MTAAGGGPVGDDDRIAIVGMAGRFPGADTVEELWAQAVTGRVDVTEVPAGQAGEVPARGMLADTDRFDAGFFGIPAGEAAMLDPQQRVLLEVVQHAFDDAGVDPRRAGCPVSVYVACAPGPPAAVAGSLSERYERELASSPDFAATRISYRLGLRGESMTVQTGCSSSLVAVHLAVQSLLSRQSDLAVAGGVSIPPDQDTGYLVEEGMIASPTGRCRPFDAAADGTLPGGGAAAVVLRRLPDARRAGARIHAVILGSALNNDGSTKVGFMAPSPTGQAEVIATAQAVAGVPAASIGYVETHGTATRLGDAVEVEGLRRAFAADSGPLGRCALGSLKANVGHLDRAAGIAGLVRAAMAVRHGVVPPMAGFDRPNPELGLDRTPFFVPRTAQPWPTAGTPRRAGVSAFGVGGTNAHVVLEEPPRAAAPESEHPAAPTLVVLSGHSPQALSRTAAGLAAHLDHAGTGHPPTLADVAFTLATGRPELPYRAHVVADSTADLSDRLRELTGPVRAGSSPTLVLAFPGQGEEVVDGLPEVYRTQPVFRAALEECARLAARHGGIDILDDLYGEREPHERAERFVDMGRFQPAMFAVQWALAEWLRSVGVRADAVVGHSLGEVVAATYAGVFALDSAVAFVVERSRRMERTRPGATLSVALPVETLRPRLPAQVSVAAVNGRELTAVTGPTDAVDRLAATLTAEGVSVRRLHIHRSPHGPAMADAARGLGAFARSLALSPPSTAVLCNVTGDWTGEAMATADYWATHLCSPVRFADQLARIAELPAPVVVLDVGPGSGLGRVIEHETGHAGTVVVSLTARSHAPDVRWDVLHALGRLWEAGVPVKVAGSLRGPHRVVDLPGTPFDHSRRWPGPASRTDGPAALPVRRHSDPGAWLYQPRLAATAAGRGAPPRLRWLGGGHPLRDALAGEAARRGGHLHTGEPTTATRPGTGSDPASRDGSAATELVWWVGDVGQDLLVRAAGIAADPDRLGTATRVWVLAPEDPDASLSRTALARAAALVLPQEFSGPSWHAVELADGLDAGHTARLLLDLMARPGPSPVSRLEPDGVRELVHDRAWPHWRARPLRPGGCYVITGGLGLVGQALARALAREVPAELVLVGRRPDGRVRAEVDALAAELGPTGSRLSYRQVDVTDATAVATLFGELRSRFGRVDGVVHAAGFTDRDRFTLAAESHPDVVAQAAAAKVAGARSLHAALASSDDADFVLLCSSLSVVLGGVRFGPYVAANAALDEFARRCHAAGDQRWISVAWDAWAGPGPRTDSGPGHYALSADDGHEVFRRVLGVRGPVVVVSTGELSDRIAEVARQVGTAPVTDPAAQPAPGTDPDQTAGTGDTTVPADPAGTVRRVLHEVLGRVPEPDRDLRRDGLESLTILRIVTRLRAALQVPIPLADAMRALTVAGLTELATRAVQAAGPAGNGGGDPGGGAVRVHPVPTPAHHPTSGIQRRWLELRSPAAGRTREYWRRHFAGAPGPTRVPGDGEGEAADRGRALEFELPAAVGTGLRGLAEQHRTTAFALMMTAFGVLLHGLTGRDDLVVGTTAAGRPWPDTEEIVGVFVNPLPLRLRVDPAEPAELLLRRVHDTLVEFHEHGDLPMEELVASVEPFVGCGLNDTFHCYLLYQNYPRPAPAPDVEFRPLRLATSHHHKLMRELEIVLEDGGDGLRGELWFRPSRFSEARAAGWRDTYRSLLEMVAEDPECLALTVGELFRRAAGPHLAEGPRCPD